MQKTIIAVYDKQQDALDTVEKLKAAGFGKRHLTILGKVDADDTNKMETKAIAGVGSGLALGGILGGLAGVGIIAIPGLGFLAGAGALVGTLVGLDFGVITGGIISNLLMDGEKNALADVYDDELRAGKTLLIAKVNADKVYEAHKIIEDAQTASDIKVH